MRSYVSRWYRRAVVCGRTIVAWRLKTAPGARESGGRSSRWFGLPAFLVRVNARRPISLPDLIGHCTGWQGELAVHSGLVGGPRDTWAAGLLGPGHLGSLSGGQGPQADCPVGVLTGERVPLVG